MAPPRSSEPRCPLVKNSQSTVRSAGFSSSGTKRLEAPKLRTLPAIIRSMVRTEKGSASPSSFFSSDCTRCRPSSPPAPDSGRMTAWT